MVCMRNNKEIKDVYVGMRIKMALPTSWCQVRSNSPYHWLKGKIIEIPSDNCIIVSIYSKKVGRINRMMCFRNKKTGKFDKIIKQR